MREVSLMRMLTIFLLFQKNERRPHGNLGKCFMWLLSEPANPEGTP